MSAVDQDLLLELFQDNNVEGVRFHQDGVVLKGNAQDDKRNFTGSLILVLRPVAQPQQQQRGGIQKKRAAYLVWIPYSYLFCMAPHLVSPAVRRQIDVNGELPLVASGSLDASSRVEWMYTMCIPLTRVAKLQRKSNLRGKRIVTLFRVGGGVECPLIFQEGGMSRLFDELKHVCTLRQVPNSLDEFLVEDREGDVESSSVRYVDPQEMRRELYESKPSGAPAGLPMSPQGPPSASAAAKSTATPGKSVVSSLLSFGAQLTHRGSKIMQTVVSAADLSQSAGSEDAPESQSFDMVQPIANVEDMVPRLSHLTVTQRQQIKPKLSKGEWDLSMLTSSSGNPKDRRIDPAVFARLREKMYFGGVDESIRADVWAYLLQLYPVGSTLLERETIDASLKREYEALKGQWKAISAEQEKRFTAFRERKSAIEKDVIRTDRFLPEFAEDDSPKLTQLHDVLMSYAMFNFDLGYCQGMSDIVAVFVLLYDEEWKIFGVFRQMMQLRCEGNFRSDVKQNMQKQLEAVEKLIEKFAPALYQHLRKHLAEGMTFCFRWLLILFKREFDVPQTMALWDTFLSCPFTPQFECFTTAALLRALSGQIVDQSLTYDELLKFSNRLAGNVDVTDVIILSHEFYDVVSDQVAWKLRLGTSDNASSKVVAKRPTLEEALHILCEQDASPTSPSPGAPKQRT